MNFEDRFKMCMRVEDDVEKAACLFDLLSDITKLQDVVQLAIPPINESVAISKAITNDANALLLEVSRWRGDIRKLLRHGYIMEKIKRLITDWNAMAHDYNITYGNEFPLFELVEKKEDIPPLPAEEIKELREEIFADQDKLNRINKH